MKTVMLLSRDYEDYINFSLAITKEYMRSVRPSAVKVLTYTDGTIGMYFGREDVREIGIDETPTKQFYVSSMEDAAKQIEELNNVMNNSFDGMRVSKPYITTNGNNTVVFVVAEVIKNYDDEDEYEDDEESDEYED